jgi:hypothetical protein
MNNTNTQTDASAVKVTRTYAQQRDGILNTPMAHNSLKDIIRRLDNCDVCDAITNLEIALSLFNARFEEIKKENA